MKRLLAAALVLLSIAAGCSKPSAEDYYAQAEGQYKAAKEAADTLRNRDGIGMLFQPALDSYLKVVNDYPDDPLAENSLFMTATIRNNELRNPEGAVESYELFAHKYPDAKRASMATFLVGYLYHNDLHRLDSAASWYRRFLEQYPQHEMAASAQFELNSLGRSPDELLPADTVGVQQRSVTAGRKSKKTGAH